MLGLRVRNVDLLGGWLMVETSKNGEGRKVALTRETSALLRECVRGKQPDDFVLTRQDGGRVAQPQKDWYNLCVRCGLGKWIKKQFADGETSTHYQGLLGSEAPGW
jgi:integrase